MKWLEVIHLRYVNLDAEQIESFLAQLIDDVQREKGAPMFDFYRDANLKNDVCLQLHHGSREVAMSGSSMGIYISSLLKKYGMVDHTVWIARENKEKEKE